MSNKERRRINIDEEQASLIDGLPESRYLSFTAIVRLLLGEAIAHRQSRTTPSEVVAQFDSWSTESVKELMAAGLKFLTEKEDDEKLARQMLLKLISGQQPTAGDVSVLADELGIDSVLLSNLIKAALKSKGKSTNGSH